MGHKYLKYKPSHYNGNVPSVLHLPISTSFLLLSYPIILPLFQPIRFPFSPTHNNPPPKDTEVNSICRNSISYLKHFKDMNIWYIFIIKMVLNYTENCVIFCTLHINIFSMSLNISLFLQFYYGEFWQKSRLSWCRPIPYAKIYLGMLDKIKYPNKF